MVFCRNVALKIPRKHSASLAKKQTLPWMFVRDFFENFQKTSGQLFLYCRLWKCVCLLGKSWKNQLLEDPGEVVWRCSIKKGVPKNSAKFTGKHLCQSLFLNKIANLRPATLLRKRLAQVLSCGFCEISKNSFFW